MTDYADLEKRLRDTDDLVTQARGDDDLADQAVEEMEERCHEAADAIRDLTRKLEEAQRVLRSFGDYGDDPVEVVARAMARLDGHDPDSLVSQNDGPFDKRWRLYQPEAERILGDIRLSRADGE